MINKNNHFDVLIVGGGPAGLSALLWCEELNLNAVLFEKEAELGGQLLRTHNAIRNYLGVEATNGRDLRDRFLKHIENTLTPRLVNAEIVEADLVNKLVRSANGKEFSGKAVFISTGVRRRKLDVPGEEDFFGRGVLESGVRSVENVSGKTVVIVGGGDAALENAIILSQKAGKVVVVHRRNEFSARRAFTEGANEKQNIEFILDAQVVKITGNKSVDGVELVHLNTGKYSRIDTDHVLIRVGVEPNTEIFRGQIGLDKGGYVIIDPNCQTDRANVFAGGDVANRVSPTISVATGHGAAAMKYLAEELCGNGSR